MKLKTHEHFKPYKMTIQDRLPSLIEERYKYIDSGYSHDYPLQRKHGAILKELPLDLQNWWIYEKSIQFF